MAEIVGDAGGGWIIDYLREFVGSDADLAAREQAREDTWRIKGISALGSFAPRRPGRRARRHGHPPPAAVPEHDAARAPLAHAGRDRRVPSLQRLRHRLDPACRRPRAGRLSDQHDRPRRRVRRAATRRRQGRTRRAAAVRGAARGHVTRGTGVGRLLARARGVRHAGVPAHRRRRARERRSRRPDVPVAPVGRRARRCTRCSPTVPVARSGSAPTSSWSHTSRPRCSSPAW